MPVPEPSPGFKRLQKATLRAARVGLAGGFAVISADLAVMLAPERYAWLAFAVTGGTMSVVYWWVWGRIFRNLGCTVK